MHGTDLEIRYKKTLGFSNDVVHNRRRARHAIIEDIVRGPGIDPIRIVTELVCNGFGLPSIFANRPDLRLMIKSGGKECYPMFGLTSLSPDELHATEHLTALLHYCKNASACTGDDNCEDWHDPIMYEVVNTEEETRVVGVWIPGEKCLPFWPLGRGPPYQRPSASGLLDEGPLDREWT